MRVPRLAGWLLASAVVLAAAPAWAQRCERPRLDCASEDAGFRRRVRALARRHPDVAAALEALRLRRLAWCEDRNACGIDDDALRRLRTWTDSDLAGLEAAAGSELGRAAWARSLPVRAALAANGVVRPGGETPPPMLVPETREAMARLEVDIESYVALQEPLTHLAAALEVDTRPPPVCASDARRQLRQVVRHGGAAASTARSLHRLLDEFCDPFERHADPDDALQNRMRRFLTTLSRIEGWMNEILRCVDPGPYDGRCENAYGRLRPDTAEQARAALRMVAEVRRAVDGIPAAPFPCDHPVWERVARSRWTLGTARSQLPSLARDARALCAAIGVDAASVEIKRRLLREQLERAQASVVEGMRARRQMLGRMRATFGLEP